MSSSGNLITTRLPSLKKESIILQCHCYQMNCVKEGTDVGSTCGSGCKINTNENDNSDTTGGGGGGRYEWEFDNCGQKFCTCPICTCKCRKAYKMEDIDSIMTQLALNESQNGDGREKGRGGDEDMHRNRVQGLINRSFSFGYQQRGVYDSSMRHMKEKGKSSFRSIS